MSRTIQGVSVQGTAEELDAAEKILSAKPPLGWAHAAADCGNNLKCALGMAFGSEEAALRAMAIQKRYGYTVSLSQEYSKNGKENIWSLAQVKAIQEFLGNLPAELIAKTQLGNILLYPAEARDDIKRQFNFAVDPAGIMVKENRTMLISTVNHDDPVALLRALIHEFGHAFDFSHRNSYKDQAGYNALSGWDSRGHASGARFVDEYAASNPEEDFANSFREYVINPKNLRDIDPKKYAWLKDNVFEGKEVDPPGLIRSSELEQKIAESGGYVHLLMSCLRNLDMRVSQDDKLFVGDSRDRQLTRADLFFKNQASQCFSEAATGISNQLPTEQSVCQAGGADGVVAHLNAKLKYPLEQALNIANEQVQQVGESLNRCVPREFVSKLGAALAGKLDFEGAGSSRPELEQAAAASIASRIGPSCVKLAKKR
jgi:hypothetical protein